jgi:hypothetical protein
VPTPSRAGNPHNRQESHKRMWSLAQPPTNVVGQGSLLTPAAAPGEAAMGGAAVRAPG